MTELANFSLNLVDEPLDDSIVRIQGLVHRVTRLKGEAAEPVILLTLLLALSRGMQLTEPLIDAIEEAKKRGELSLHFILDLLDKNFDRFVDVRPS